MAFGQGEGLPKGMAPWEHALVPEYMMTRGQAMGRANSAPPTYPVRTMAEWEEVQALAITWTSYPGILKQIVRYAKDEVRVLILCQDAQQVTNYLQNGQFGGPIGDLGNVELIEAPYNSIWIRDFGPETMYRNEVDSLVLMDWIYNRPRPLDDAVSQVLADHMDLRLYSSSTAPYDLVHTGGNFMSDGFGTGFSSELVDLENGPGGGFNQTNRTPSQVDAVMNAWMGISPYVKMTELPFDNISHIDMHMKLLDEERLLVGQFPTGVSDGPQVEANIQYIQENFTSVFGTPYEILRIPMVPSAGGNFPPDAHYRTYANNIFINGTVIVPTYREEYDTTGLRILREALPGYRVVGIDCDDQGQNIISASGAIHCITKTIGVDDPLLIRHQRLRDTYETMEPYRVEGYIRHRSGIASAEVRWSTDTTQAWQTASMTDIGEDLWEAFIPAQPGGTTVFYHIHATAVSGKQQQRPFTSPVGSWKFNVLDINTGLDEASDLPMLEAFPNPVDAWLTVAVRSDPARETDITLVDALGRTVRDVHRGAIAGQRYFMLDVSGLDAGAYMVVLATDAGRVVQRVVVR